MLTRPCIVILALSAGALLLGQACGERPAESALEHQVNALKNDPSIEFLAPANNKYFDLQEPKTPVSLEFAIENWETFPEPGKEVAVFLDNELLATLDTADPYVVANVPFGVHSISLQLQVDGEPLSNPEARAVRYVRVTTSCLEDPECDEGNPCTINACVYAGGGLYECGWGFITGCCFTLFDCPVGTIHCGDIDGDGLAECVDCLNDQECDDGNPCSEDLCTKEGCLNLPMPNSCAIETDCDDNNPCTEESCDVAQCACHYSPVADCCLVDQECDDDSACTIDRCIFNKCRHGPKFIGQACCTDDADCVPANPCHKGTCVLSGGNSGTCSLSNDPAKPGCCTTDASCPDLSQKWLGACLYNADAQYYKCAHYLNPQWCETTEYGVLVNEVMVNPLIVLDSLGEWVELFNAGEEAVDLSGYHLDGGEGEQCQLFPEVSFPLAAGDHAVIARYSELTGNGGLAVDFACGLMLSLENSVDSLTLIDNDGNTVDAISWEPQLLPPPGASLARRSPYLPGDSADSWQASAASYGDGSNKGTPGQPNSDLGPLEEVPLCDDGVPCTMDLCSMDSPNICAHAPMTYCCLGDDACDDGNACTVDDCQVPGICHHSTVAGCCNDASVCDDDDDCTADACINHACRHGPKYVGEVCCVDDTDCESVNPCQLGYCEESICEFFTVTGCCAASWQCHDWNPCTKDICDPNAHICQYSSVPGCCQDAEFCESVKTSENYCRPSYCIAGTCKYGPPAPDCCATLPDCDDNNVCTADACDTDAHQCVHEQTSPLCCNEPADCPPPVSPCTAVVCLANSCTFQEVPGCCVDDGQCDDNNICTLDVCVNDVCHHAKAADDTCCTSKKDCADDGLPCTTEVCIEQNCVSTVQSPCYQTLNYYAPLDLATTPAEAGLLSFVAGEVPSQDPPVWQLTGAGALGPDRHLRLEMESGTTACLALPFLKLPTGVSSLTVAADIAVSFDSGVVVAELWGQKVTTPEVWQTNWTRVFPETGSGHYNIAIPVVGPSQGFRRYAFCFKPFGATGTIELDGIAAAIGTAPKFLTKYPTIPLPIGMATTRSLRAHDPDKFPFQVPLTFALKGVPPWITLGQSQSSKDGKTWVVPLHAQATKIKGEGDFPVLVMVYDEVLFDSQQILVRVLSGPCQLDNDCADGNECTTEGCVDGECVYEALTPCCGDGEAEGVEQCDDGNAFPLDGCTTGCKLEDNDGDGLFDYDDNCPWHANNAQADTDGDGFGNLCDPDLDGDGVPNSSDNCPNLANGGQYDNDFDGVGDWCDADDDNDQTPDVADNCPLLPNPDQLDADEDGSGDSCDPDDDNDEVPDTIDNCEFAPNPSQQDLDGDLIGDACDEDADGDGYVVPLDCDDANPSLFPILIDYRPEPGTNWRWHQAVALNDHAYFAGSPQGSVPRAPYSFTAGKQTRLTNDQFDYQPMGASTSVAAWAVTGSDEGNVLLDHDGWLLFHSFPDLQPDSATISGNSIGWLSGSGEETEVHLWKEGHDFTLTNNDAEESELALTGSQMFWQSAGEIVHFTGQFAYDITEDTILDERPRTYQDELVWTRRDGSAGSGNIVHMNLDTGLQTHITKDSIDDSQVEIGGFGAAWKRKELNGKIVLAAWNRKSISLAPTQPFDTIETIAIGDHFVAWVGNRNTGRDLYVWDGTVTKVLGKHLPDDTRLAASGDRLAWIGQDGPHLAAWVCTSLVDADGDGSIGANWGGDDCDDGAAEIQPGLTTIDLTMGATTEPGPPVAHLGKVAWSAYDGHDREIYLYDGKGILSLTNNAISDSEASLYAGVVVWTAHDGEDSVIMRYDGKTLLPVDGAAGGASPTAWGETTVWLTSANGFHHLHMHSPTAGTLQVNTVPVKDGWYSLTGNQIVYASATTESSIRAYDMKGGTTTIFGQPLFSNVEPIAFGEAIVWRTKKLDWDVFLNFRGETVELSNNSSDDIAAGLNQGRTAWLSLLEEQTVASLRHADGAIQLLGQSSEGLSDLSLGTTAVAWVQGTGNQAELMLWDGITLSQVTDDDIADASPSVGGREVAWLHGSDVYLRKPTCGADFDADGLINAKDNCPYLYNPNQSDLDGDAMGDSCDPDDDGDLVVDPQDNCPALGNPGQSDVDGDGLGNECDPDGDGDGYLSTTYGGDDCDDLDAESIPIWTPVVISGGVPQNGPPEISADAAVWHGTLFGTKQIFAFRNNVLYQLTSNALNDENPSITDSLLVWEHDDGHDKEVWTSNLQSASALTDNDTADRRPRSDGQNVVWYGWDGQDYEIFHSDGVETTQITYNGKNDYHPQVSGDLIVWRGFNGDNYDVFMKRGGAIYNISKNDGDDGIPYIEGESVIWSSFDGKDYEIVLWENEVLKTLTSNGHDDLDPVVENGRAIWRRFDGHDYEIVYYTGLVVVQLTNDDLEKGAPKMSKKRVVWAARTGIQDDWELYTYKGGKTVKITNNNTQDVSPAVFGDVIVWKCDNSICRAERSCK